MKKSSLLFFFALLFALNIAPGPASAQQDDLKRAKELTVKSVEMYSKGRYTEAISLAEEALELFKATVGTDHPATAVCMNNLGVFYRGMGKYDLAEPIQLKALEVSEKTLGPEHATTTSAMNNLALLYEAMGEYARAEPLFKRALAIRERVLGPDHPGIVVGLNSLAAHYITVGEYDLAKPLYKRSLALCEKALGPNHYETAACLNNLAVLNIDTGNLAEAEVYYKRALAVCENAVGPEHPATATSLGNLSSLYIYMGEYALAEPLCKRALSIREKVLGANHPDTAFSLNTLALLYTRMGDLKQAAGLYLRALDIYEKTKGPEHPDTARTLDNLANILKDIGGFDQAERLYQRALAIREKALGPEHPETANSLQHLAGLYRKMSDFTRAEPLSQRVVAIREKNQGPDNPLTAQSLQELANLYRNMGKYALAESLHQRVVNIFQKTLGPGHPDTADGLYNMAIIKASQKDYPASLDYFIQAQNISAKLIDQVMGFTSEDQQQSFLVTQVGFFEGTASLVAFHMVDDQRAVRTIFDMWLNRRGVILEAQRRFQEALVYSDNPESARIFKELAEVRSSLSRLIFGGPGPEGFDAYQEKIDLLEKREKELATELSKLSAAFARQKAVKQANAAKLAQVLPKGSVLLEFAQIEPFDFQAVGKEPQWLPAHYLVFVLRAGVPDRVDMVDLGEAAPIDRAIRDLKSAITNLKDTQGKKAVLASQRLYELVFAKLENRLGTAKDIFLSPDGELSLIPFEVLQKPNGGWLIEEYTFNYLASGRDLLGFGVVHGQAGPPLLMGDPDFDLGSTEKEGISRQLGLHPERTVSAARRSPDLRGLHFTPLPGTGEEVKTIREILGPGTEIHTGREAMEEILASNSAPPRILHLATHGFFLTDSQIRALAGRRGLQLEDASKRSETKIENPLLRSGLAFAGANRVVDSDDAPVSDGLFTAEEVLGLRLNGTELVVLSACNTGTGEVRTGEGVYGLRRAFVQAGTKGLVMSMWPVPDQETKELMIRFYQNIQAGKMNRSQALRQAEIDQMHAVKERYGHANPIYWGAFVYLGEP